MLYVDPMQARPLRLERQMARADGAQAPAAATAAREDYALEELEHVFVYTLLQEMRKTIPDSGLLQKGPDRRIFDEMLDDALSGAMAKSGQLGIACQIEAQLRAEEAQHALRQALADNPERKGIPLHSVKWFPLRADKPVEEPVAPGGANELSQRNHAGDRGAASGP